MTASSRRAAAVAAVMSGCPHCRRRRWERLLKFGCTLALAVTAVLVGWGAAIAGLGPIVSVGLTMLLLATSAFAASGSTQDLHPRPHTHRRSSATRLPGLTRVVMPPVPADPPPPAAASTPARRPRRWPFGQVRRHR